MCLVRFMSAGLARREQTAGQPVHLVDCICSRILPALSAAPGGTQHVFAAAPSQRHALGDVAGKHLQKRMVQLALVQRHDVPRPGPWPSADLLLLVARQESARHQGHRACALGADCALPLGPPQPGALLSCLPCPSVEVRLTITRIACLFAPRASCAPRWKRSRVCHESAAQAQVCLYGSCRATPRALPYCAVSVRPVQAGVNPLHRLPGVSQG